MREAEDQVTQRQQVEANPDILNADKVEEGVPNKSKQLIKLMLLLQMKKIQTTEQNVTVDANEGIQSENLDENDIDRKKKTNDDNQDGDNNEDNQDGDNNEDNQDDQNDNQDGDDNENIQDDQNDNQDDQNDNQNGDYNNNNQDDNNNEIVNNK